ncbi:hypothetical protein PINS_up011690 [Pythium insidiosum]|nr:hypothetical protein PINS_up011690 [Pythium insidiosum]
MNNEPISELASDSSILSKRSIAAHSPSPVVRSSSFRRRHSDMDALTRKSKRMVVYRSRRSDPREADDGDGDEDSADGTAANEEQQQQQRWRQANAQQTHESAASSRLHTLRAIKAAMTATQLARQKAVEDGKRYHDLVERFQIRRVHSISTSTATVTTSRTASVREGSTVASARAAKVHPGLPPGEQDRDKDRERQRQQDREREKLQLRTPLQGTTPWAQRRSLFYHALTRRRFGGSKAQRYRTTTAGATAGGAGDGRVWWRQRLAALCSPMSPTSTTARVRFSVVLALFCVDAVYLPLELAFPKAVHSTTPSRQLETALDVCFLLDVALYFNTAFVDERARGRLVFDRRRIVTRYLRGWFFVDLLASMPFEALGFGTSSGVGASVTTWRWLQVVSDGLLRIPRLVHLLTDARRAWVRRPEQADDSVVTRLFYSRYAHLVRIVSIIVGIVFLAHYLACCWLLLTPPAAAVDADTDADAVRRGPVKQYVHSLYVALQLLQGQGVNTTTVAQDVFAAVAVLIGSVVLAVVFGHVAILVSNFNANTTSYQRKMESVFAVMSKLQLPVPLRERIHQYYEHLWREYESLDGEIVRFTKDLSHTLELEVVLYKYMDLVMHVPFWRECSPDFQKQLMLHLHVRVYLPDDYVLRRGEVGDEFYMINRGVCELVRSPDSVEHATEPMLSSTDATASGHPVGTWFDSDLSARHRGDQADWAMQSARLLRTDRDGDATAANVQTLVRGQSFGELALIMNYERRSSVRATSYVEMCVLKRADMQRIFVRYREDRRRVLCAIVATAMRRNDSAGVACPLREAMAASVGTSVERLARLPVIEVAMRLVNAMDVDVDDDSIRFGIGPAFERRAIEDPAASSSPPPSPHSSSQRGVADDATVVATLETLVANQQQLLQAVEELKRECEALRQQQSRLMQPEASPDEADTDTLWK